MSGLILPNRQQQVNIEFNVSVLTDGNMAIQCRWTGGMVQLPPVQPEIIAGIGEQLKSISAQVIAKRIEAGNGSIFAPDGPGQIVS